MEECDLFVGDIAASLRNRKQRPVSGCERDVVEWKEHRFESQEDPISISAPLLIPLVVLDIF